MGELNNIFSGGTSAQDQSEGNLAVVLKVFDGAANLAENVSYTKNVCKLYILNYNTLLHTLEHRETQ